MTGGLTSYRILLIQENETEASAYSKWLKECVNCEVTSLSVHRTEGNPLPTFSHPGFQARDYQLIIISASSSLLDPLKRSAPSIPVLLIADQPTVEEAVAAIRLGAEDYLKKPVKKEVFQDVVRRCLERETVFSDHIENHVDLQQLVYIDDSTGLYNTRYLNYVLDREITQVQLTHQSFAVLFIDADRFKNVNQRFGHPIGTQLLNELGGILRKSVRERDTVFRYGGDEFIAVLSACDLVTAKVVAEKIRDTVEKRVFLRKENLNIHFTISIGIALFPEHAKTKKEIIEAADRAMFEVKNSVVQNSIVVTGLRPPDMGLKRELREGPASGVVSRREATASKKVVPIKKR